jgi:hypothetical protein
MDLRPSIRISSLNHLGTYEKIVKSASFWEKFFYNYHLPDGFPRIKKQLSTYFSRGKVTFKDDKLIYTAFDEKSNSNKNSIYHNLQNDLTFTLNRSRIKSIDKYHFKNAYGRSLRHWIRITCDEDIMDGDFLISTDNVGNTDRLFKMLNHLKEGKEVTISLTDYSANKFIKAAYLGLIWLYASFSLQIFLRLNHITVFGSLTGAIGGMIALTLFFMLYILPYLLILSCLIWFIKGSSEKASYHWARIFSLFAVGIAINSIIIHYS